MAWTGQHAATSRRVQESVLYEAIEVFADRNAKYQDLFKKNSREEDGLHISSKGRRIAQQLTNGQPLDESDALDLINYVVFAIRNERGERVGDGS